MKATLTRFRVQNFRSIEDSGWIAAEDISCLVGTNESGKTNLLLALWKLNPANGEPIMPLLDYPRKVYHTYKNTKGNEVFITAEFELNASLKAQLARAAGKKNSDLKVLLVNRRYNGKRTYYIDGNEIKKEQGNGVSLKKIWSDAIANWKKYKSWEKQFEYNFSDTVAEKRKTVDAFLKSERQIINDDHFYELKDIQPSLARIEIFTKKDIGKNQDLLSFFSKHLLTRLEEFSRNIVRTEGINFDLLEKNLPTFVYYSDYGNLDSEIYLPHVIENFHRKDLGEKERAKSRSLKVLFNFVDLQPNQILDLGKEVLTVKVIERIKRSTYGEIEVKESVQRPDSVEIEKESERKKEREILLQSASNLLTKKFREWWRQGEYGFRFQADGNHFRIWVTDDKRSEPIELEGRSKGLQWFFSFFLVFLVESKDSHANCILLLDEPGLSLHPMAQMDLISFFDSLAKENQLIYTTHSPFLVSTNHLSGVHAMFVNDDGKSVISGDLRVNRQIAERSIYPVHAAIGLTVSDTLLLGCQPVLVEGTSDQIYLQLIKKYVLSQGQYKNDKEVVFIPTGGVKSMKSIIKLLLGRDNNLPFAILDSDKPGQDMSKELKRALYREEQNKLIAISEIVGKGAFEIEDLMPGDELAKRFGKQYRSVHTEDDFDDLYQPGKPIVDQMEAFAKDNGYSLPLGWKVDLAKEVQRNFDRIVTRADETTKQRWLNLMQRITS